jgi:hypothetical protein
MPLKVDKLIASEIVLNGTELNDNSVAHYELDRDQTDVVTVNTTKGIIDILGMEDFAPSPGFGSSIYFVINNPDLDLTVENRDNIYVQYSVYYSQNPSDNAIPYLISTGISSGVRFDLYNANPADAEVDNWSGALYVYYELYTIN